MKRNNHYFKNYNKIMNNITNVGETINRIESIPKHQIPIMFIIYERSRIIEQVFKNEHIMIEIHWDYTDGT